MVPAGATTSRKFCSQCGQPQRIDSVQRQYENRTRTPIYLYAGTILFAGLVGLMIYWNIQTQKEKALWVANPKVGDVYLVRQDTNDATSYYFFRVSRVKDDTVQVYHNNLVYNGFVTGLAEEDYFVTTEELIFTKSALKDMLEKDEINSVERGYGDSEGFNRIR